jgi:hypothetical protein
MRGRNKRIDSYGYVSVYTGRPGRGWVAEQRLVMEKHLGGPIPAGMQVHHRDENKLNNALSNLELLPLAAHRAKHRKLDWHKIASAYLADAHPGRVAALLGCSRGAVRRVVKEWGL